MRFPHAAMSLTQPRPIVVVDDTEDDVFLFKRLLEKGGVTDPVLPFCDSAEAIKYFGRVASGGLDRPLVCFLDINMPGHDGFAVLEAIRASDVFDTIPTVMLSTSDDRRDIVRSMAQGADGYLVQAPFGGNAPVRHRGGSSLPLPAASWERARIQDQGELAAPMNVVRSVGFLRHAGA